MKRSEINVPVACGMDWDAMQKSGTDPKRFCGECKKHVHNLSSMTKEEASELLSSSATEGLCVRYLYDKHGNVVFDAKKEIPFIAPNELTRFARAKRYVAAAVTLALPMSLNACMGAYQPPARAIAPVPTTTSEEPMPVAAPSASPSPSPSAPASTAPTPVAPIAK